jgi:hypothetical protein
MSPTGRMAIDDAGEAWVLSLPWSRRASDPLLANLAVATTSR